jgi:hypothetical protein
LEITIGTVGTGVVDVVVGAVDSDLRAKWPVAAFPARP